MGGEGVRQPCSRLERGALRACGACFAVFCTNVVLRRAARAFEWEAPWLLERVPEFLVLFASTVLFATAALAAERRARAARGQSRAAG